MTSFGHKQLSKFGRTGAPFVDLQFLQSVNSRVKGIFLRLKELALKFSKNVIEKSIVCRGTLLTVKKEA